MPTNDAANMVKSFVGFIVTCVYSNLATLVCTVCIDRSIVFESLFYFIYLLFYLFSIFCSVFSLSLFSIMTNTMLK